VKTFRAADLTRHTGDIFEAASRAPVAITKHRRPRFVLMSIDRFEELTGGTGPRAYRLDELPDEIGRALDDALTAALRDE
jgi:prevent-host-death family protein